MAPEVQRAVVHQVPDHPREAELAAELLHLGARYQLLQRSGQRAFVSDRSGAPLRRGAHDKAAVLRTQRDREDACAPGVPRRAEVRPQQPIGDRDAAQQALHASVQPPVQRADVAAGVYRLLLRGVASLRHGRHAPAGRRQRGAHDAVANREDAALGPPLLLAVHHLQVLVDQHPAAAPGAGLAEGAQGQEVRHEVAGAPCA
mmetsp:Transcript_509/g.1614  ORF Transcript_509/g.1614 Transcript_509/m.1614 type:complete len:202 (-) Transcript_509:737-1342(-)